MDITSVFSDEAAVLHACYAECGTTQSCLRECLERDAEVSLDCSGCFAQLVQCLAARCAAACAGGLSASCSACACDQGCGTELETCAGIATPLCTACAAGAENTAAACSDGCSNDGDEWIDCDDSDCAGIGGCPASCPFGVENTLARCSDGCDNDGDSAVDCDDSECAGIGSCPASCPEGPENTLARCSDGCDNDGDSAVDCADSECEGIGSCPLPPECTPGETRCIEGDVSRAETCSAAGRWTSSACPAAHLCTVGACRRVCYLDPVPTTSHVCYVPNRDGVNDGILFWSNDPTRMQNGVYTGIQVHSYSSMTTARIQRIPSAVVNVGDWPYEWVLDASGSLRQAEIQFRLDQFSALPGPLRTVTLRYWARRHPPIVLPDVTINYETRAVEYGWAPAEGRFFIDNTNIIYNTAYYDPMHITSQTIAGDIGVTQFDHSGGLNEMGIEIQGNSSGSPPMETYVNFIMLTVQ